MKSYTFGELTPAKLAEVAVLRFEHGQAVFWDELARREIGERERSALGHIADKLVDYKATRSNEATLWARAIYPLLALAERGTIRAFSLISLAARFEDVELHGETDGALASNFNEDVGLPYLVVVEAKRGAGASDPMSQLLGAMLCAARLNEQDGRPAGEIFGCYTIADVWTFLRGNLDWSKPKPGMSVLSSREYWETTEAATILAILDSVVAKVEP
jgi:hypothetical protein